MSGTVLVGSRITLHYTLSLSDGTLVDTTRDSEPLSYRVGDGTLLDFLERQLLGMNQGAKQRFEISAEQSLLPHEAENIQVLARRDFPEALTLEVGQVLGFKIPSGDEIPGQIIDFTDQQVTVDFSNPLSGRELVFDVEILAVGAD